MLKFQNRKSRTTKFYYIRLRDVTSCENDDFYYVDIAEEIRYFPVKRISCELRDPEISLWRHSRLEAKDFLPEVTS